MRLPWTHPFNAKSPARVLELSAIHGEELPILGTFTHDEDACGLDKGMTFLKVADARGWAPLLDPNSRRFLFEEVS